jgi:microcin C transport system permease protein
MSATPSPTQKNPKVESLNQRRWRVFYSQKRARIGMAIFFITAFFSLTSEIWSNHLPIYLKREGRYYFPIAQQYPAEEFGITDSFTIDYQALVERDRAEGRDTQVLFPPNRWDPYIQGPNTLQAPSSEHWLGTDNLGRDVMARLLYGVRVSLSYGVLFWLFSYLIGVTVGSLQGFFGGMLDFGLERFKELAEIVPFLSVVILVNGLAKSQSFFVTLMIVVIFGWVGIASQIRAQFLALRKREFAEAAVAMGGTNARVIFRHILPNALTPVLTLTPFAISVGIGTLATLDYLGFGLNPPTPSLGELLSQGRIYITNAPWLLLAPTAALAVMLIAINLIGESLRQAFDPRKG